MAEEHRLGGRAGRAIPWAVAIAVGFCSCAAPRPKMGVISTLSQVEGTPMLCDHRVPEQVCTRHHPELIGRFKAVNDWCPEHGMPESQCFACHPDLTFEPLPALPPEADLKWLSKAGEDVSDLASRAVKGKVTVFDFYADWCAPCRKIDLHVYKLLQGRSDLAFRKLNVVSWDTPLAKRYLPQVDNLPYLVIHGKKGEQVTTLKGLDLAALDRAIDEGAR